MKKGVWSFAVIVFMVTCLSSAIALTKDEAAAKLIKQMNSSPGHKCISINLQPLFGNRYIGVAEFENGGKFTIHATIDGDDVSFKIGPQLQAGTDEATPSLAAEPTPETTSQPVSESQGQISALEETVSMLKQQLAASNQEVEKLKTALSLKSDIPAAQSTVSSDELQGKLRVATNSIDELKTQLENAQKESENLNASLASSQVQIGDLTNAVASAKAESLNYQGTVSELKNGIAILVVVFVIVLAVTVVSLRKRNRALAEPVISVPKQVNVPASTVAAKVEVVKAAVEPVAGGMKKCPFCAEDIKTEAMKCKHCGSDIPDEKLLIAEQAAVAEEEEIATELMSSKARTRITAGYVFAASGFLFAVLISCMMGNEESGFNWGALVSLGTYVAGIVVGYLFWATYWGIYIVAQPIKNWYSGLIIFTNEGVLGLIMRQITITLGMYLLTIPLCGMFVGSLGGGFYMHRKHAQAVIKQNPSA